MKLFLSFILTLGLTSAVRLGHHDEPSDHDHKPQSKNSRLSDARGKPGNRKRQPNPNAILANKAPMVLAATDAFFTQLLAAPDKQQDVVRAHITTVVNSKNSILGKNLAKCSTVKPTHKQRLATFNAAMNMKTASSSQKTSFMKKWFQKVIASCAVQIKNEDLLMYSLELGKIKLQAKIAEEKQSGKLQKSFEDFKNEDPYAKNVTAKAEELKNEAQEYLNLMMTEYKETVPEEHQENIDEMAADLRQGLEEKWENEWKGVLIEKVNGEWKDMMLEKIGYEEADPRTKKLMDWFGAQIQETLEENFDE